MRELHLFAGAGGGILGCILLGHVPVCAVEIDPYCRKVLAARQADGCLPGFPILEDVRAFDGTAWRGKVDVVCGGFPCQPWSTAGKRLGTEDPRHLWPEMARIISEVRPAYVFAENVSLAAFEQPWRDLRGLGYRVPPALCLGASHLGAPHRRLRWWMLAADSNGNQHEGGAYAQRRASTEELSADSDRHGMHELATWRHVAGTSGVSSATRGDGGDWHVADASSGGLERSEDSDAMHRISSCERYGEPVRGGGGVGPLANPDGARLAQRQGERGDHGEEQPPTVRAGWWATEPRVGRVAHGVASRVDRLKALGNGQVPQVAAAAFRELMGRLA